uniref:mRNA, clone: rafl24-09-C04 n=1 Tax=Solanum tuberosum TaxID=4113 RepID=M0ZSM4_SOLTU
MLRAIGIGNSHSLPLAAALNWVLKDGLGRLCRCIYTASLASSFDTNLKRVRFCTSVLFSLSIGVELLTPVFPQYFLILASIANIAKQISLACYLATSTAVHRSFAVADNLGEVSAKGQIQTVCFDNLGLTLAATLNILSANNPRLQAGLIFVMYPVFSVLDLFGIYQGLKHVHLQTLTKDRLKIIISTWIQQGFVPSPEEVSKQEGIGLSWSRGNF